MIADRRGFRAFLPDPHHLDTDNDGIACESATPITATPTPLPNAVAAATVDPTFGPITLGPTPPATPVGPVSCSPRPRVVVNTLRLVPAQLRAIIAATSNPTGSSNTVRALTIGTMRNASIDIVGVGTLTSGQTVQLAGGAPAVALTVRRSAPGQGVFVPLTVTDGCGPWQTFVGAGPDAL